MKFSVANTYIQRKEERRKYSYDKNKNCLIYFIRRSSPSHKLYTADVDFPS